jgi:hypothetical protein
MKKFLRNGLMLAAAGTLFFTACDPEEEVGNENPSMTITTDPADGVIGINQTVSFTVDVNAPAGFNTVRLTSASSATIDLNFPDNYKTEYTRNDLGLTAEDTEATAEFSGLILPVGGEFTFTFLAVDENGSSTEEEVIVTVNEPSLNEFTAQLLGGIQNDDAGSFFDAVEGQVYTVSQAFQTENTVKNDLVFWYGGTSGYAIGSVDDPMAQTAFDDQTNGEVNLENLNPKSLSRFKYILADVDFDNIESYTDILSAFNDDGEDDQTRIPNLAIGDVFGITLDDNRGGRIGLIEIENISGDTPATRSITINVKIQSEDN